MTDREKNLESILKQLLTQHFFSVDLEWGYPDSFSLKKADRELYIQILQEVPEVLGFHRQLEREGH